MRPFRFASALLMAGFLSPVWRCQSQSPSNSVPVLTTLAGLSGQNPNALLLGPDGNFYGTTAAGGSSGAGTVFMASPAGAVTNLYSFTGAGDGANPAGRLLAGPGGFFYGVTSSGGNTSLDSSGAGTVFQVSTNGVLTTVYSFTGGNDGDTPLGGLSAGSDGAFYGTTLIGGDEGYGAAYRVTAGGGFSSLGWFDYTQAGGSYQFPYGSSPGSVLLQGGDGNFYGTTQAGGDSGLGGIFQLSLTNGFTPLFSFTSANGGSAQSTPGPQLIRAVDGSFYGVTFYGGSYAAQDPAGLGYGTIFRITTNGVFTEVYSFSGGGDGANPVGALAQAPDGSFAGVAQNGGAGGFGTIFQLGTNGSVNVLHTFAGGSDGGNPPAGPTLGSDGSWYGVTAGTFYRLGFSTPPFITVQPASQTNSIGTTVTFSVTGGGSAPLGYQWQFNGANLPGATGTTLVLTNVQSAQAGDYTVVLTNPAGTLTSSNAVLSLFGPPVIITQPASQGVVAGSDVDLAVLVSGNAPFSYQWGLDGTNLPGATAGDLPLANIQVAQSGNYFVVVGNSAGSVTSAPALVVVTNPPPSILTQPTNQVIGFGQTTTLAVQALGISPTTYQWQFNGQNIALATNSSLVLTNAQTNQSGVYDVVVTDPAGAVTSSNATLTVTLAPAFGALPVGGTVLAGTNVTLSAIVGGFGKLSYQWQYLGADVPGATNVTLELAHVTPEVSGLYTLVVTNSFGSVTSTPPTLLIVNDNYEVVTLAGGFFFGPPRFIRPQGVALDGFGNVYAADSQNNVVWLVTSNGVATVLAGKSGFRGGVDGPATNATFNSPGAVAVDASGNVYVADSGNDTIRLITTAGVVSTFAGTLGKSGFTDGQGAAARFNVPAGVALDSHSNLYVADQNNDTIRKITPGGLVSTLAGAPGAAGNIDGPVATARFFGPGGVAVDVSGNIFVADTRDQTIRVIGTNGIVRTLAGFSRKTGAVDGVGTNAFFNNPASVAVDKLGNVFVADTAAATIRMITTNDVVTTQSGRANSQGYVGGLGNLARFSSPSGVAVDTAGNFYVADANNGALRKGFPLGSVVAPGITTPPQSEKVAAGANASFAVGVTGTAPLTFQWYFGGRLLTGATLSTLTVTNAQAVNAGTYSVVVTNIAGKVTSVGAILQVGQTPPQEPPLTSVSFVKGAFSASIQSQVGVNYVLEYKNALTDPVWQTAGTVAGTGGVIVLSETGVTAPTRFYRVAIQ